MQPNLSAPRGADPQGQLSSLTPEERGAYLYHLFAGVQDAILVSDASTRYIDANPAAVELLGYSHEELLRLHVADLLDEPSGYTPAAHERIRRGRAWRGDLTLRRKDGTQVPAAAHVSTLTLPSGALVVAVLRDITRRKQAEQALAASESRARAQYMYLPIPTYTWQHQGDELVLVDFNEAASAITDSKIAELLGITATALYRDTPAILGNLERCWTERTTIRDSLPYTYLLTGVTRQLDLTYIFAPPDLVMVHTQDITVRHEAETALRASEERFRALVQNVSDIISIYEADGRVRYISPAIERVLGYRPAELEGETATHLVHPDDRSALRALLALVTATAGCQLPMELRVRARDGEWRIFESIFTNLQDDPNVRGIVAHLRDITERVASERQLVHQAYHDPLTGLPNRALFRDRLTHALARRRANEVLGVVFLDLDGFKHVNDSLGHPAGDALLQVVAERLSNTIAAADTVARFGGDEFAVLLEGLSDAAGAIDIADRLLSALRVRTPLEGREVFVTASAGVALARASTTGIDSDGLLRQVDVALYQAKAAGKDRAALFDPGTQLAAARRLELETDLRRALEHDELVLYYQPEVELATGAIAGMEALVRWRHPRYGLLPPDDFIPIAEETGLILQIGEWTLVEACRQLRRWSEAGRGRQMVMSINLSARELQCPDLVEAVATVLHQTEAAPGQVRLEVTETAAIQDAEAAAAKMRGLKALGVQVALDDFGTGHSSLNHLRLFPVDVLKLDGSFVREMSRDRATTAIVESVAMLARRLGMAVTAEGIETPEQVAALRALTIDRGQGHLYAPALPADAIDLLLAGGRQPAL